MNGEVQQTPVTVPIVTLAGLSNLTNLLTELPLPTPIEPTGKQKSLLFNPRVADEARRVLATADPNIISQMAHVLQQTNVDHIQLKEGYTNAIPRDVPELVRVLLAQYPDALDCGRRTRFDQSLYNQQPQQPAAVPQHLGQAAADKGYQQQPPAPGANHSGSTKGSYDIYSGQTTPSAEGYNANYYNSQHMTSASTGPLIRPDHQPSPSTLSSTAPPVPSQMRSQGAVLSEDPLSQLISGPGASALPQNLTGIDNSSTPHRVLPSSTRCEMFNTPVTASSARVAIRPLSDKDIDKYMSKADLNVSANTTPSGRLVSSYKPATKQETPKPSDQPTIKLTKLEVSSLYQVAPASQGLKIKIKKTDGSVKHKEKRRRSSGEGDDFEDHSKKKKKKHKHKEHKSLRRHSTVDRPDDETFTNTHLHMVIDGILDSCNLEDMPTDTSAGADDEEFSVSSDLLIARSMLSDLASETAKLKGSLVTRELPPQKLMKLMSVLHWNVRDGAKLVPTMDQNDLQGHDMLRDLVLTRVKRSLDAALAALHMMTSTDMPKAVYLEDLIELIAEMVKYQLTNTIYPEYDPVYDSKKDKDYTTNKQKRSRAGGMKDKSIMLMYNKLCEVLTLLTELVLIESLTDTIILKMSALAVQPFFVENVSELQLAAITLVTEIFSRYEKHRQLILDDMFLSLARLPTTKRNIRAFRLNHEENVQMVTALVLQLIQCIIQLPAKCEEDGEDHASDVVLVTSYEQAMKTAHHFLSVFLKKCGQKGEEDYRPLFDNFVNDLLVTANKPEWPAAELMLSLLGRLLVQQFSNKSVDMALRVASLDYLGTVAARLRRDAVCTQQTEIDDILEAMSANDSDSSVSAAPTHSGEADVAYRLQLAILDYLLVNGQKDPSLLNARSFYIAQWYRDFAVNCDKLAVKQAQLDPTEIDDMEITAAQHAESERKKSKLLEQALLKINAFKSHCKLTYSTASDVTKFLTSQRPFAQSFDVYLAQILKVLSETVVAVRTKAIRCLTQVIEADPGVLSRTSLQTAVHARLLDQSTAVREACVELIGKFILCRPELITQYYNMLSDRILDTGISVRKRVIKIFRDVCIEMPNFDKIPDMCVKMIRRVNDEDGIKKLVSEVFQSMWFTPVRDKDSGEKLMRRVLNITSVISAIADANYEFMEHLIKHLMYKERDASSKPMALACKQIVDCLVMNVLKLEQKAVEVSEGKVATSRDLLSSLSTLYLFSKIRPDLMTPHGETLQPYLEIKCSNSADVMVLHHVSRILELVIPLMDNPRESFLAQVEEDLMALILSQGMTVLQSAVSCLGAVINKVTKNFALVRDCFKKFQNIVFNCHKQHQVDPTNKALVSRKSALRRSLFTIGVLCKHFDFDSAEMAMNIQSANSIEDFVFEQLMYFLWHEDESIRQQALTAIGFFCIRYYEKMMTNRVKELYHRLLIGKDVSAEMRVQVLNNLGKYLQEEEETCVRAEEEWQKRADNENLKEMGDVQSGMASTIVQVFLKELLEAYFNSQTQVRVAVVSVIHLILKQGLIHPVQCVPYLIAMSTDCEIQVTIKADQHLLDINKKYMGFIHMKAMAGMKMSYRLHRLIQQDMYQPLRGIRDEENPQSLNSHLYSIIRTNRPHRRALLSNLLNLFDDSSKTLLGELVYMADNIAFFPYTVADEPLYVIHTIDIIVSVAGSNILQSFREGILTKDGLPFEPPQEMESTTEDPETGEMKVVKTLVGGTKLDDDDNDDVESLLPRLPDDCSHLQDLIITSHGCILLLQIKQHLKEMYNINDSKLQKYSPNEAQKVWERPISRKVAHKFTPSQALELLKLGSPTLDTIDSEGKQKLLEDYLDFKQLMMTIDPNDDEDEDKKGGASPTPGAEDYNDPEHPGYADPQLEITSFAIDEADALAATMQPTISLMPIGEMPPDYAAQLHNPSTSGFAAQVMPGLPPPHISNTWTDDSDE